MTNPKRPSAQYLRTLAPKAVPFMVFGARVLTCWVLGPSGKVLLFNGPFVIAKLSTTSRSYQTAVPTHHLTAAGLHRLKIRIRIASKGHRRSLTKMPSGGDTKAARLSKGMPLAVGNVTRCHVAFVRLRHTRDLGLL